MVNSLNPLVIREELQQQLAAMLSVCNCLNPLVIREELQLINIQNTNDHVVVLIP